MIKELLIVAGTVLTIICFLLVVVCIYVLLGAVILWALNQLGFLLPFEWSKAIAITVILMVLSAILKR